MGVIGRRKVKRTKSHKHSTTINGKLYDFFEFYNYKLFNSYIYGWESDFFAISKAGYTIEIETKIDKNDFKKDFTKRSRDGFLKHDQLLNEENKDKPNKFYFACPDGLINKEDIDKKYGLIWVSDNYVRVMKEPMFLHKDKILDSKYYLKKLLDKFYYKTLKT